MPIFVFLGVTVFWIPGGVSSVRPELADFEITESTLHYSDCCGSNHYLAIVGRIRNNGSIAAKAPHFEARFYGAGGELIDSLATDSYDLVISPRTEATFRVRGPAQHPESAYETHDVRVTAIRPPQR